MKVFKHCREYWYYYPQLRSVLAIVCLFQVPGFLYANSMTVNFVRYFWLCLHYILNSLLIGFLIAWVNSSSLLSLVYFERVYSDKPSESDGGRGYWMNKAFLAVRHGRPLGFSSNEVPLLCSATLAFDSSSRQNKIKNCH